MADTTHEVMLGYNAYRNVAERQGESLPQWEDLSAGEKERWRAVSQTIALLTLGKI